MPYFLFFAVYKRLPCLLGVFFKKLGKLACALYYYFRTLITALGRYAIGVLWKHCGGINVFAHALFSFMKASVLFRFMLYSNYIRKVKQQLRIPVIANGDVVGAESALRCLQWTGADGLMIGRATFGDPWIFAEVKAAMEGKEIPARPPLDQRVDTAIRQFELSLQDKGEKIACLEARKHFAWYLRGVSHSSFYKDQISHIMTMEDAYRIAKDIKRDLK